MRRWDLMHYGFHRSAWPPHRLQAAVETLAAADRRAGRDAARPPCVWVVLQGGVQLYRRLRRGAARCRADRRKRYTLRHDFPGRWFGMRYYDHVWLRNRVQHNSKRPRDGAARVYRRLRRANPKAALIDVNGTLYGTTFHGGDTKCKGCGTVFSITPSGVEKVLHSFSGPPDGAWPAAALINVNGTLYGTTAEGGTSGGCRLGLPKRGCGTVYSISPSGSENVLFRLVGPATGSYPAASLIDVNGTLYGTTENGGGGHGPGPFTP